jgi:hypothetical protein
MSKTFSFLITVDNKGNLVSKAYEKKDSHTGINDFVKAREDGKEAYFYQHPVADKRCKSSADTKELAKMVYNKSAEPQEVKPDAKTSGWVVKTKEKFSGKSFNPKATSSDVAIDLE